MQKSRRRKSRIPGLPPGSLVYTGDLGHIPSHITVIHYGDTAYSEKKLDAFTECLPMNQAGVTWIHVDGIAQVKNLEKIGECFSIHPLVLEDILDVQQRPKIEDYEDYLYIVLKAIRHVPDDQEIEIRSDQVSLILGPNYVISFHEGDGDLFAPVRVRLLAKKGRICKMGADYLAYSLIDLIVDNYFVELETFSTKVESLEDQVVAKPMPQTLRAVHRFKNDMIMLRQSLWPLREVIARLERRESPLVSEGLGIYLKDVYDHIIIAIESVETYRDILSGMLDIYLSSVNNRLTEIMRVLTIIATIFMPLNFITSFYGMNFKNMPELEWHYGYYGVVGLIVIIAVSMITLFKKKRWF
jgi:magnesium transporter